MVRRACIGWIVGMLLGLLCVTSAASALSVYTNLRPGHAREFEAFLATHVPDVSVSVEYQRPTPDDVVSAEHDLTLLSLSVSYLANQGALAPLDVYLARNGLSEEDVKGALASISTSGRVYHLPVLVDPWVVMYNRALFDQKGISYPENEWTWTDFARKSAALTERSGSLTRVWGAMSGYNGTAGLLLDMSHQTGRSVLDVGDERLETFFELWTDMVIRERSVYDNRLGRGHSLVQHFRSSGAAMQITTLLTAFNWADQDRIAPSIPWDVAPLPSSPGTVAHTPVGTVYAVGVGAASQHTLEAWDVAKFIAGPEAAEFFVSLGYVPASLTEALIADWTETSATRFSISPEGLSEALNRPLFKSERPEYGIVVALRDMTPQLEAGGISQQDALGAIQELRQRLLHGE